MEEGGEDLPREHHEGWVPEKHYFRKFYQRVRPLLCTKTSKTTLCKGNSSLKIYERRKK